MLILFLCRIPHQMKWNKIDENEFVSSCLLSCNPLDWYFITSILYDYRSIVYGLWTNSFGAREHLTREGNVRCRKVTTSNDDSRSCHSMHQNVLKTKVTTSLEDYVSTCTRVYRRLSQTVIRRDELSSEVVCNCLHGRCGTCTSMLLSSLSKYKQNILWNIPSYKSI